MAPPRKSAFEALHKTPATKANAAPRIVPVPPSAWASDWAARPVASVDIGLRFVSDTDIQLARSNAAKEAWARHPIDDDVVNRADAFNDALLRWIVARGTCKPHDSTIPWFMQDVDDATAQLSVKGAQFLFEEIDALAVEQSPLSREATDEEVGSIAARLATVAGSRARQARRLLAKAIDLMSIE